MDVSSLAEPGGTFTYTLKITNNGVEPFTITDLTDTNLAAPYPPAVAALIGQVVPVGESVSASYEISHDDVGGWDNTAEVTVEDNEGTPASATDSELVEVYDIRPTVTLEKLVDKTVLPEPGGDFNFTLVITNTSVEPVMITQLVDTNLPTESFSDYVGDWLAVGESISIPYTVNHTDAMTYGNWAEVTVEDNEGTPVTERAEQSVEVLDEPPTVTLDKSVDVDSMTEPGGTFNFKLTITNTSVEPVEIADLTSTLSIRKPLELRRRMARSGSGARDRVSNHSHRGRPLQERRVHHRHGQRVRRGFRLGLLSPSKSST